MRPSIVPFPGATQLQDVIAEPGKLLNALCRRQPQVLADQREIHAVLVNGRGIIQAKIGLW